MKAPVNPPSPEKKNAPSRQGKSTSDIGTFHTAPQAPDGPHLTLTKNWLRCGEQSRMDFLRDVRAAHPAMWRVVSEEESL